MKSQRMYMMNLIGQIEDMENILSDIVDSKTTEIIDTSELIENSQFMFPISSENVSMAIDSNYIKKYHGDLNVNEEREKLENFSNHLNIDLKKNKFSKNFTSPISQLDFENLNSEMENIDDIREKLQEKNRDMDIFNMFGNINVSMSKLLKLENFNFKFGILSKEDRLRIKKNYENIFAAIFHMGTLKEGEVYFIIYPGDMEVDISRVLRSLNFHEIKIPEGFEKKPSEITERLTQEIKELEEKLEKSKKFIDEYKKDNEEGIAQILKDKYNKLNLEDTKTSLAVSSRYFYLAGWISKEDSTKIYNALTDKYKVDITFHEVEDYDIKPPTKLKNNSVFKPFELLVKMYGVPNYEEIDPTPFFAITYMLLFGSMFGDVGQGLFFAIAGILVGKFINKDFGGLVTRLGVSSTIFGFLYGSVFGLETVIQPILFNPYENINTILIMAIALGVILLIMSYSLGVTNYIRTKNFEELYFGEKGIAGFLLYISILGIASTKLFDLNSIIFDIFLIIAILCILSMIFKKVLYQKFVLKQKTALPNGYFIESSFSIVETIISIFSGTISFIRVGAFAINHVGLFLAFSTIGNMIGTKTGSIVMIIIGNIVILGLEGLIVFIQSLRLEYYEMFSKYYIGDGREFIPDKNIF
ncbi:V-type ATP synthase subunit I [Lagierella massiliensis]|uniref:V-type ATP synthase subunit I n=1 Tax=Lagierella massiliensis TaxID=1689303 RepID=UPI0006D7A324|nr:V-type ATPase 116kDa subunit family protein [Lagierella massiliensis]